MSEKWSNEEVRDKVNWEGGVISALEWGLLAEWIEDPELNELWSQVENLYGALSPLIYRIEDLLDKAVDDSWEE